MLPIFAALSVSALTDESYDTASRLYSVPDRSSPFGDATDPSGNATCPAAVFAVEIAVHNSWYRDGNLPTSGEWS